MLLFLCFAVSFVCLFVCLFICLYEAHQLNLITKDDAAGRVEALPGLLSGSFRIEATSPAYVMLHCVYIYIYICVCMCMCVYIYIYICAGSSRAVRARAAREPKGEWSHAVTRRAPGIIFDQQPKRCPQSRIPAARLLFVFPCFQCFRPPEEILKSELEIIFGGGLFSLVALDCPTQMGQRS